MVKGAVEDRYAWAEPGVYEVARGVHRIPLPLPNDRLRAVNVYAIVGEKSLVLIDSGWATSEARAALDSGLRMLGCGLGDVSHLLVTHVHRDHFAQAVALRHVFGTPFALGRLEEPSLRVLMQPGRLRMAPQITKLRTHGAAVVADLLISVGAMQPADVTEWELPNHWVVSGQLLNAAGRTLQVIETPGHTQGHVMYLDRNEDLLFAGDHILPHITPSVGFETSPVNHSLGDYLDSLRIVRSLPDMQLLPAHGPTGGSVRDRVDTLLAHHNLRLSATLAAVAAGADTAYSVARNLTWTRHSLPFEELDPFNQAMAVLETAAHLELLATHGKVQPAYDQGMWHYGFTDASSPG